LWSVALVPTSGPNRVLIRVAYSSVNIGKALWGGEILAQITRTLNPEGNIASIGLASGSELDTTVIPFILRGVSLLGINSIQVPHPLRIRFWTLLATD